MTGRPSQPDHAAHAAEIPTVPSDNTTLTAVLCSFDEAGYVSQLVVDDDDGTVRCTACGATTQPRDLALERLQRLEGASDPADMAAVIGARCPICAAGGTAVLRFGPEASRGEATLLLHLDDQRRS